MKITITAGLLLLAVTAGAANEPAVTDARNCVDLGRIDQTRVLDDSTIVFYMRGDEIFINRLPRRCSGLRNAGTFGYKTSLTQLCNVDIITVLRQFDSSFTPGPSCGLGMFEPITADGVAQLRESLRVEPERAQAEVENPVDAEIESPDGESPE